MGGRHRTGRHRRKPPILRRALTICSVLIALIALYVAFNRPTQTVSDSVPSPVTPLLDVSIPTTEPTTETTSPTDTKAKKKKTTKTKNRSMTIAPKSPSSKIEKDGWIAPSTEINRPVRPAQRPSSVIQTTPRPPPETPSSQPQSIQRQVIDDKPTPKVTPKPTPKPTPKSTVKPKSKVTTTPRVAPSPQPKPTPKATPKPTSKPQTKAPVPPSQPRVTTNPKCGTIGLLPQPRAACNQVLTAFPQIKSVLGVGSRAGNPNSCHPNGLAIDFIVGTDKALGDRLFAYVIAHRSQLGATPVVLWQVAGHFDHVHVSFVPCKG